MKTYIYGLKDPRDGEIYYVGKSNDPRARLSSHLKDNINADKVAWIDGLLALNLRPELVVLENVNADKWQAAERRWIADGHDYGWPLVNISPGGNGDTGKEPPFDFLKPFLDSQQWHAFEELDLDQKWHICWLVSAEMMGHSWVAIKAGGGNPEEEYSQDTQFVAGLAKARQLVAMVSKNCGA